ncbi:phosphoesterase, MJ0936 family [Geoglobus ahangari]|uniref:Phosphoesterase n=1 Tax=Geoglobus ahangari TaxID=113653 RepID=A0A0F7DBY5_9EURY|nr:metallophosphoesterase [Geoglobus ahangari]AKG91901.1 phosphoesterase, MJ0936 family [Geoglobus ahangari]NOY11628.1 metallophosphoesterase [Archaeoglobi archaeon]
MRFIAFSDSHDNVQAIRDLLQEISREKVDFYVHAGDVISPFALKEFLELDSLYLAFGNNDGDRQKLMEIAVSKGWVFGDVLRVEGIAVYHGTSQEVLRALSSRFELVVCGHTHRAEVRKEGRARLLNPGEVCGYLTGRRTYAIYEDGEISIVEF